MKTASFAAFVALLGTTAARAEQGLISQKALSLDMALAMAHGSLDKCRSCPYNPGRQSLCEKSVPMGTAGSLTRAGNPFPAPA